MELNVTKQTLLKNILQELKIGNFNIPFYEDFIKLVQHKAISRVKKAIVNDKDLRTTILDTFGTEYSYEDIPTLNALYDPNKVKMVNSKYMKELLTKDKDIQKLIEAKSTKVTKATMINAYKISLLEDQEKKYANSNKFNVLLAYIKKETKFLSLISNVVRNLHFTTFSTSSSSYVKAKAVDKIVLPEKEKEAIKEDLHTIIVNYQKQLSSSSYNRYKSCAQ